MKQFNKIYFNGCSHTVGGGLEIPYDNGHADATWCVDGYREIGMDIYWKSEREVAYPQRISEELNIKVENHSIQGGSFQRLHRMFYEYFTNNDITDTLFFLQYPYGLREEFWSTKLNEYFLVNTDVTTDLLLEQIPSTLDENSTLYEPLKSHYQHLFNPDCKDFFINEILDFIGIVLFCERQKINLIFTDYKDKNNPFDRLDKKFKTKIGNLLNQEFEYVNFITHPYTWCLERDLTITEDLKHIGYSNDHPSYSGHIKYAQYVSKKLKEWYK